jgi:hypothetical protein
MGKRRHDGVQIDIYGNHVHMLNAKEIFRMVKCGKCGDTVKSSQARLHLSYGKSLNICKKCIEEIDKCQHTYNARIRDSSKIGNTIESYGDKITLL